MNESLFDIVIIGAGPAGATLAFLLQKSGVNVCLVDKASFPRAKLCGGLVTEKTALLYKEMFGEEYKKYISETSRVSLYSQSELLSSVDTRSVFRFVDRWYFDMDLVQQYINIGGIFFDNQSIEIDHQNKRITRSDGEQLNYQLLIGADGALSKVRKLIDSSYSPNGFCIERSIAATSNMPEARLYFSYQDSGYGWVFPNNIGIGGSADAKKDIVQAFDSFHIDTGVQATGETRAALIPFGKYVKKPADDGVILIGDAAGLVDPVTGEGLYFALKSAKYAFESTVESINASGSFSLVPKKYLIKVKSIHKVISEARLFRWVFLRPKVLSLLKDGNNESPRVDWTVMLPVKQPEEVLTWKRRSLSSESTERSPGSTRQRSRIRPLLCS
jgi:geranylgeranyl reductase family protein